MERRTFLIGSALALRAFGANEKVNVAIVGIGGRGKDHVKEYLKPADGQRRSPLRRGYGANRARVQDG